jgi:hypothetical protein
MTAHPGEDGEDPPPAWQRAARAFTAAVDSGRLDLPLPGSGATWQRWAAFTDIAGEELSVVRLCEGHADAVAIRRPAPGARQPLGRMGRKPARP